MFNTKTTFIRVLGAVVELTFHDLVYYSAPLLDWKKGNIITACLRPHKKHILRPEGTHMFSDLRHKHGKSNI